MLICLMALFGLLLSPLTVVAADTPAADAPPGFETTGVELYLKKNVMAQRATNEDLATYTKALQAAAEDYFAAQKDPWKEDLDIVVAVKPGPQSQSQSRVWLVSRVFPEPDDRLSDLRDKLAAVPPPPVTGGPVAFCIHAEIAGGNGQPPSKLGDPPFPQEWSDALGKAASTKPVDFDDLMALVSAAQPANTWRNISGQILIGGFLVAILIGVGYAYWRNQQRKRRT